VEAIVGELVVAVEDCGWRISMEGTSTPAKATLLWEELTEVVPSPEEGQEMPMEGTPSQAAVKDPWVTRDGEIAQGSEDMAWHCG